MGTRSDAIGSSDYHRTSLSSLPRPPTISTLRHARVLECLFGTWEFSWGFTEATLVETTTKARFGCLFIVLRFCGADRHQVPVPPRGFSRYWTHGSAAMTKSSASLFCTILRLGMCLSKLIEYPGPVYLISVAWKMIHHPVTDLAVMLPKKG